MEIGLPMLVLFVALSQYLKHVQVRHFPILERFSVLISIALLWVYAHILTVSGAYKHSSPLTQVNCRTDRANLITTAQWYVNYWWIDQCFIFLSLFHTSNNLIGSFLQDKYSIPTAMGCTNFQCRSFIRYDVCCAGVLNRGNVPLQPCDL